MPDYPAPSESIYRDYVAVIWPTVKRPVLRALCQAVHRIPVELVIDPNQPTDRNAILMVLTNDTLQRLWGLASIAIGDHSGSSQSRYWRLGYIRHDNPHVASLRQALETRDAPLQAVLRTAGGAWTARVVTTPGADESARWAAQRRDLQQRIVLYEQKPRLSRREIAWLNLYRRRLAELEEGPAPDTPESAIS